MVGKKYISYLSYFTFLLIFIACTSNENKIPLQKVNYCNQIKRNSTFSLTQFLSPLDSLMQIKTGVQILEDGGGSMVTRAWFSEYAEKTIDVQYFIFSTDNLGLIACDYLVRAANRGVKVRILVDDIMVDGRPEDILIMNSHKNISIKIYNPGINLGKNLFQKIKKLTTDFRSANQRMHNKTFTVDNKIAITGGRNIADEYFDYDREFNFRDRDVLLLGKETKAINRSFNEFWNSPLSVDASEVITQTPDNIDDSLRFENLYLYACNPENFWPQARKKVENYPNTFLNLLTNNDILWLDNISFISDTPGKNDGSQGLKGGGITTDTLIEIVNSAEKSIDIQTPYLITTAESRLLFQNVIERGVKINILTNSLASTDNVEAFSAYQKDREKLLSTGVNIYEFRPDAEERKNILTSDLQDSINYQSTFGLHAKTMVIDNKTTVIGTFNLDPRSTNLNTECITIISSPNIASSVLVGMHEEYKTQNSWKVTADFNPDEYVDKVKRIKTWTRKILPKDIL